MHSPKWNKKYLRTYLWRNLKEVIPLVPKLSIDQSLIKGSLSTRPNTSLQIRSWHNFYYTKIVALIEGEDWNAIGMPANQRVNNSQHKHTHKDERGEAERVRDKVTWGEAECD